MNNEQIEYKYNETVTESINIVEAIVICELDD